MLFDPSPATLQHILYYKDNLKRYTRLIAKGEFDKILRPGKFDTEPPNNLELILKYTEENFGGLLNSTKTKYESFSSISKIV